MKIPQLPSIDPRTAAGITGAALVTIGAALVYLPAGFIVAGVLILVEVATSRAPADPPAAPGLPTPPTPKPR